MSLNKVMLIGRLTRDPELRYLPTGQPVTSFGLATNRYSTGPDGERREMADFHNCVAWNIGNRNLAEIVAEHVRKGSLVYVEGRLQTRSWQAQDGTTRRATEVVINDIQFLARAQAATGESGQARELSQPPAQADIPWQPLAPATATSSRPETTSEDPDDDIPF